ncbi:hypothetical protein DQ04_15041000 [Trypanosoma grayi]|uniref:hypothetical protein n=1 Tax=Trypanosoma grayi TaxID=71804 RepID=UPI0004F463CB|nr:hypothetical protein DQ04_15041000 [Trypanosoma grayi]KEG06246.1 hypothetical protein DQ04_15041000 [Trypanosoma grayi]
MYRGSCAVLLQAVLTQACRTILALCTLAPHSFSGTRAVALASMYVSKSEASSLIESMGKHTLLTAVHILCCEHHPHLACRHHNGELAAAVNVALETPSLRSTMLAALTEFIARKWKNDEVSNSRLLPCATSVGATEHVVAPSSTKYHATPTALLLQVYPQLAVAGSGAEVDCGCPHQWFRETLPIVLLTRSMEQHAWAWRRTSLLLVVFVRWRQRHGMCLLRTLLAGEASPPMELSTQAPSTIPSDPPDLRLESREKQQKEDEELEKPTKRSAVVDSYCHSNSSSMLQKPQKDSAEKGDAPQETLPPPDVSPSKGKSTGETKRDNPGNGKLLKTLLVQCDKLVSERMKRYAFFLWRDVRFGERCKLKQCFAHRVWCTKQRCLEQWKRRLEQHHVAERKASIGAQCHRFVEAKTEQLQRRAFSCWLNAFMVRRFRLRTCGCRLFSVWRRAYIFVIHAQGKSAPPISHRALATRCLEHWRDDYRGRVADRYFLRRFLLRVGEQIRCRSVILQKENVAVMYKKTALLRRCLRKWDTECRLHHLCAHFGQTTRRRLLFHALEVWRVRWLRCISGRDRMETFLSMHQQRLFVVTFTKWRKRAHLRQLSRRMAAYRLRGTYRLVWTHWLQRAIFHRRLRCDRMSLAVFAYQRLLLRGAWHIWQKQQQNLRQRRCAIDAAALLSRAHAVWAQRLLATSWFAWKGRAHLRRLRRYKTATLPPNASTPLGVNRSFAPHNLSISCCSGAAPRRDPLAALRAERLLLREMGSTQWQATAHARLFNNSCCSNGKNTRGHFRRRTSGGEETMVITMPSDVEDDHCPSFNNSRASL